MLSASSRKPWLQEQYSCPPEATAHCCVQLSIEQVVLAEIENRRQTLKIRICANNDR